MEPTRPHLTLGKKKEINPESKHAEKIHNKTTPIMATSLTAHSDTSRGNSYILLGVIWRYEITPYPDQKSICSNHVIVNSHTKSIKPCKDTTNTEKIS